MAARDWVGAVVLLPALLAACARDYHPAVDMTGVDPGKYNTDLASCAARAQQAYPGGAMFVGAVAGATIGTGIATILGNGWGIASNAGLTETYGAIAGGVAGTGAGAIVGTRDQRAVIDDCLMQDGYKLAASGV